jgi:hypothetical protein
LGSIGHQYGTLKRDVVSFGVNIQVEDKWEQELLSTWPSRSRYSHGFLFDEGFNLLTICKWDSLLCCSIIESWFKTMDQEGWIPLEQARGAEAV